MLTGQRSDERAFALRIDLFDFVALVEQAFDKHARLAQRTPHRTLIGVLAADLASFVEQSPHDRVLLHSGNARRPIGVADKDSLKRGIWREPDSCRVPLLA